MNRALRAALTSLIALGAVSLSSCLIYPATWEQGLAFRPPGSQLVQEGELTLQDGEEKEVLYKTPYEAPPRLGILELKISSFQRRPFRKDDFQFVDQSQSGFRIQNTHPEQQQGSWVTIRWRAEGRQIEEGVPAKDPKSRQAQVAGLARKLGGKAIRDPKAPDHPIVSIDLHGTGVRDADLAMLEGLATVHTLNLYGTRITDAGLVHLRGLTGLQTLHLNETSVGDAGLKHLEGLKNLKELGLNRTHVSEEGLRSLSQLTNLQILTLGGKHITDHGLPVLYPLANLKRIFLTHTSVTPAGADALKRAIPAVAVLRS
jgi:hypothetical protein